MSGLIRLPRETFEEDSVLTGAFQSKAYRGTQLSYQVMQKEIKSWVQQVGPNSTALKLPHMKADSCDSYKSS